MSYVVVEREGQTNFQMYGDWQKGLVKKCTCGCERGGRRSA